MRWWAAQAEGLGGVNDFALDSTSLFWSEFEVQSGAGAIKRVPKNGGNIVVLASGTPAGSAFDVFSPLGIALDDSFVYWGENSGGGAVRRVPKAGGMVADIGRGQGFGPVSLVLDGDFFYGSATDRVTRLSVQGEGLETLASNLQNPMSVLTDDQFVYWVELAENGRAARVPKEGGEVAVVAGGLSNIRNIVLDRNSTYFASSPSGQGPGQPSVLTAPKQGGTVETAGECPGAAALVAPIFVALDPTSFFVADNVHANQARIVRLPR